MSELSETEEDPIEFLRAIRNVPSHWEGRFGHLLLKELQGSPRRWLQNRVANFRNMEVKYFMTVENEPEFLARHRKASWQISAGSFDEFYFLIHEHQLIESFRRHYIFIDENRLVRQHDYSTATMHPLYRQFKKYDCYLIFHKCSSLYSRCRSIEEVNYVIYRHRNWLRLPDEEKGIMLRFRLNRATIFPNLPIEKSIDSETDKNETKNST